MAKFTTLIVLLFFAVSGFGQTIHKMITNPIVPGCFADPSVVKVGDTFYIYDTIDPWGSDELGVFETKDFKTFERKHINWPTKKACKSPTSGDANVFSIRMVRLTCIGDRV